MYLYILKSKARAVFLVTGLALSGTVSAAGLVEVKQTVFGMDCAPCAHGLKTGLEKLGGVEKATVSLNDGYAAVTLAPDNTVTLEKIRQVIKENGFTPKDASVVVNGTIERGEGDQLVLATSADQVFALSAAPDKKALLQELQVLPTGSPVEIEADLAEGNASRLSVLLVKSDP